jgi:hypothetical protein
MPLQNIFLENEGKNLTADERRATWNSEEIVREVSTTDETDALALDLSNFVTTFVKSDWVDPNLEPREELGLMFTVHKKLLIELLEQDDCEGIRVFISSASSDGKTRTNIALKPVDATLEELDKIMPDALIKFSKALTECPPETRCPSNSFSSFKKVLKSNLSRQ